MPRLRVVPLRKRSSRMKSKRSYSAADVEKVDVSLLLPLLTMGCIVAIDVANTKFVAAIATAAGEVVKLIKFEHPRQTEFFLRLLRTPSSGERRPTVAMEPTGTYGDAVRHQCHQQGLSVHMMPPKHTHDFAKVFDGAASMHDAKAAVVLAKLQVIKPAPAWEPRVRSGARCARESFNVDRSNALYPCTTAISRGCWRDIGPKCGRTWMSTGNARGCR
jgi:hypothetical protein